MCLPFGASWVTRMVAIAAVAGGAVNVVVMRTLPMTRRFVGAVGAVVGAVVGAPRNPVGALGAVGRGWFYTPFKQLLRLLQDS